MRTKPRIFLSYSHEDRDKVSELYQQLAKAGFEPWMDTKGILAGENWSLAIQRAIRDSDFFLMCLSKNSVTKRGFLQRELKFALDYWQEKLDSDIYIIPIRLDDCEVPENLRFFQWVNLFEKNEWKNLVAAIRIGIKRRMALTKPIRQEERSLKKYLQPKGGGISRNLTVSSPVRRQARASQIEMDARLLERCASIRSISSVHKRLTAAGDLKESIGVLLRSFYRISHDVNAALNQESAYNQRLALSAVEERLDGLVLELRRSNDPDSLRFRPIAMNWQRIVTSHRSKLTKRVNDRQEIDNPYVIGVPLTVQQEIFVGRADISTRIEQLLLDRRRPPLLLYGQRRMGKTSLLNNLSRLLPSTIVPFFVDLQGPPSHANDQAGFLYNISKAMLDSGKRQRNLILPTLTRKALEVDPFTHFDEWLDKVEFVLGKHTALLTLDEFESLDRAIAEGRFGETAILGWLRHLIQNRTRFKVMLASSHTLNELQRWASYLINVQVVHISYLNKTEARQLIEQPVKDFALHYTSQASQRVLDLTRGHPFLVQLLCAEIVALKNEQDPDIRRLARVADVEMAVQESLSHGSFFFADIERNQIDDAALILLRFIAKQGKGAIITREILARQLREKLNHALDVLVCRELIEPVNRGYRFQVELIRRWFAQGANNKTDKVINTGKEGK